MAELKTKPTAQTVAAYLKGISDNVARKDAKKLLALFKEATGAQPVLWGNMVGFGQYHYTYPSGREGDFFATGFAMRKSGPTIYIMPGYGDYKTLLKDVGPHRTGKSCLYLKSLEGINLAVLKELIRAGLRDLKKQYPVVL